MILQRLAVLGPALVVLLALVLAHGESRKSFRDWCRIGSWNGRIRWPLPWWGVAPMPLWMFLLIGIPCALLSLLPATDWQATAARIHALPANVWILLPVLAFTNALLEELIFRLGLMSLFSRVLSPSTATIPAAVIFGAIHFWGGLPSGFFSLALLSFGGFWLGYFVLSERGISAAILFHTLLDLVVYSLVIR